MLTTVLRSIKKITFEPSKRSPNVESTQYERVKSTLQYQFELDAEEWMCGEIKIILASSHVIMNIRQC